MKPELWDGNFHPVSLHRSLEHLISDTNNIKSLACMAKYIGNKKIEISKFNNIKDFEGIGKAAWKLIFPSIILNGTFLLLTTIKIVLDKK